MSVPDEDRFAISRESFRRAVKEDDTAHIASVESTYLLMQATNAELDVILGDPVYRGMGSWVDAEFDGAWTKANDQLDAGFARTHSTGEPKWAEAAAVIYLAVVRTYAARYRDLKTRLEIKELLQDLGR